LLSMSVTFGPTMTNDLFCLLFFQHNIIFVISSTITLKQYNNPGYQDKPNLALEEATRHGGWFCGYDWIVWINPDVSINNDMLILDVMRNDPI